MTSRSPSSSSASSIPGPTPRRTPLGRRFLVVWFGQSISSLGSTLSAVGIAVWVYVETGSTAWLGALAALASIPYVLTGPLMPLVDRFPRRTVMVGADVLAAVGTTAALVLAFTDHLEVWHLAAAGFIGGVGTAFQFPAFQAAIPALVDHVSLGRANGLNQLGPAAGVVVGPMVATPLVAWWGVGAVLVVDFATFLVAMSCTFAVRFDDARDPVGAGTVDDDRTWRSAAAWLRGDGRAIAALLIVMAIVNFFLAFFNVAMVSLATTLGGAARAGLVMGAAGVAMLIGTIVLGRTGLPDQRIRMFAIALLLVGVGFSIGASRPSYWWLVAGVVIAIAAVPAVNASVATIFHERVPASMQGRVFGLRSAIGRGLEPVGSVVAGLLIASMAEPSMADGVGADTIGRLIGAGAERGSAAALLAVGLSLAAVGVWLLRSWVRTELDGEPAEAVEHAGLVDGGPVVCAP